MTNWRTVPFHTLFHRLQKRTGFPDEELLSVYRDYGVIRKSDRDDNFNRPGDLSDYQLVERGDLVLNKMKTWQGSLGISPHRGIVSPAYFVYKPVSQNDERFLHYALRCRDAIDYYASHSTGIRVNQWDLSPEWLDVMPVALPDLETQRRIADYLDKEISEMDALIEEFEVLVSTLEKRRVKLVEHTFAINTPESRSGISRVGLLSKMLRRGISPDYSETSGVRVVNQKCVRPARQVDYGFCRLHDESEKKIAPNLLVQQGDILINSTGTGTLGRSALVSVDPDAPTTFDGHVTIVRPDKTKVDPAYLAWAFYSQEKRLIDFSVGSTNQIELSRATVANLELPYPPLEKQREIADELDREFERMNALIEESTRLIENLKARKTVLITEVVTGRKEV